MIHYYKFVSEYVSLIFQNMKTPQIVLSIVILLGLLFTNKLQAQCLPWISPSIRVTATGNTLDSSFASFHSKYLVCNNAQLYYYGNSPDTIFVEGSGKLIIGYCWNLTVYMRPNAMLQIDTTQLGMKRIGSIVYQPLFLGFQDTSGVIIDTMISCTSLQYNYAGFPSGTGPCNNSVAVEPLAETEGSYLYPVPASDFVFLPAELKASGEYYLYNIQGRLLQAGVVDEDKIPVGELTSGHLYLLRLHAKNSTRSFRILKQ
jgi:hypothetical protein